MSDERVFLNESNVYVSNTKVVLNGTTYATANLTSVAKRMTPAKMGCAVVLIVVGALALLGAVLQFKSDDAGISFGVIIVAGVILGVGILWAWSLKPTYHVYLATAAAERPGLTSKDEPLIDRVTGAISDAITHRG